MSHHYELFDPLLSPTEADAMVDLCERFGRYGMYSQEASASGDRPGPRPAPRRGDELHQAAAAASARHEPLHVLAARTNYFREEYAYGDTVRIAGIEPFLHHAGFVAAARAVHGRPVIEPAIVYANILLPGQELAVHTDVPEFRGANRKKLPAVADGGDAPLAASSTPGACRSSPASRGSAPAPGGEFVFYPGRRRRRRRGAAGEAQHRHPARHRFGVPRRRPRRAATRAMAPLRPGMHLVHDGGGRWSVRDGDTVVARYAWDELRFSISWKAYCFADDAERGAWRDHTDDLALDAILDPLVDDLRARGRLTGDRPAPPTSPCR